MIENIFAASPAEIDGEIARLEGQTSALHQAVSDSTRVLARGWSTESQEHERQIEEYRGKIQVLETLASALRQEFDRRGGWQRVYVVDNDNGHTHRSTGCATCYASTGFYWFPEHSGKSDDEIVALAGGLACLTCFPGHREEIEQGRPSKLETPNQAKAREQRAAQAAKAAAKKADAEAKGITAPDGSPLLDDDGCVIKTLRTAVAEAVRAIEQAGLDEIYADQSEDDPKHASHLLELSRRELKYAVRLIKAIAAKQDRTAADVEIELSAKAGKKLAPARKDEAARKAAGKTAAEWYRR